VILIAGPTRLLQAPAARRWH